MERRGDTPPRALADTPTGHVSRPAAAASGSNHPRGAQPRQPPDPATTASIRNVAPSHSITGTFATFYYRAGNPVSEFPPPPRHPDRHTPRSRGWRAGTTDVALGPPP